MTFSPNITKEIDYGEIENLVSSITVTSDINTTNDTIFNTKYPLLCTSAV